MKYAEVMTICIYQVKTTWCFVNALELSKVASWMIEIIYV